MNDISRPGGGVRPRDEERFIRQEDEEGDENFYDERGHSSEESTEEQGQFGEAYGDRDDNDSGEPVENRYEERERRDSGVPVQMSRREAEEDDEDAGAVHSGVKSLEERDRRRSSNAFLKKLAHKQRSSQGYISGGSGKEGHGRRKWVYGFGLIVVILFIVYVIFPHATVTVTPRSKVVTLADEPFHATLGTTTNASSSEVQARLLTETASDTKSAPATGSEEVEETASGKLEVFNAYSAESLHIIPNTRFESSDGHIYRIKGGVTIPGMQGSTPGRIVVTVYADEPGESYNVTNTNEEFTIPGLKGTDYYNGFYAKLESPIAGGFKGVKKTVSPEDLESAKAALSDELGEKLIAQAQKNVPDGYILFGDAGTSTFKAQVQNGEAGSGEAKVQVSATFQGLVLQKKDLAKHIAGGATLSYGNDGLGSDDWSGISLNLTDNGASLLDGSDVSFTLSGVLPLKWNIATGDIAEALAGEPRKKQEGILSQFYGVNRAKTIMRPLWRGSFPKNADDIAVVVKQTKQNKK